jgi:thiol-disulfide isomerase/thioredoxin
LEPALLSRPSITCLPLVLALAIAGCDRGKPANEQANAAANAMVSDAPPAPGEGKPDRSHKGLALPAMPFAAPGGGPATFGAFRGSPVLVNLWATWCAPCVKELPSLDALATRSAGKLAVVAISQDSNGDTAVGPFWKAHGLTALTPYTDSKMHLALALQADSLPTTILFDSQGKEVWRIMGGKDWTGPEAATLLAEAK